jgi:di/tricarboxylate transporter
MTTPQILIFAILGCMLALFLWDRLRYDVVALLALLAAVFTGVVPAQNAFRGFSNEVLPLIAGALVVSTAIGKSGLIEALTRRIAPVMTSRNLQVGVLAGLVTVLSAFIKNIGALAIFLPVAMQVAEHNKRSASEILMPLSFGSLIGGLTTLIGTSPNILISGIRREIVGQPFEMFDFTPVGAGIAVCGVVFLTFGWRLLPSGRHARTPPEAQFKIAGYTSEVTVPAESTMVGKTVGDVEALGEDNLTVAAVIRDGARRAVPGSDWPIRENDILVVESDPHLLEQVVAQAKLTLVGSKELADDAASETTNRPETLPADRVGVVEAIVTGASLMVGASSSSLRLRHRYGLNLLSLSRRGGRVRTRLRRTRFQPGDVVVLQGETDTMAARLADLGVLPLAGRNLRLGRPRQVVLPLLALAGAILLSSFETVPAAVAFVAAATLLAVCRVLTLHEIYESIEWPILILLGCLIPVGEAVRETGATDLIAGLISALGHGMPAYAVLGIVMVITMLATPLLHHAAAVIVMGPVAASLATQLGCKIDPFLMAVAIGAGSDFLSPIGHQCNTLVLGAGGYRFTDYWRLGLPLSAIVVVVGVPLIMVFWPLH